MRSLLLAATLAVFLAAPGASRERPRPTAEQGLAAELAGLTPGTPTDCIALRPQIATHAYGSTLVYITGRNEKYRNDTGGGCEDVARDTAFLVTRTPSTQLCRGDIADAVDRSSHFPSGSCSLGAFIPYRRP